MSAVTTKKQAWNLTMEGVTTLLIKEVAMNLQANIFATPLLKMYLPNMKLLSYLNHG